MRMRIQGSDDPPVAFPLTAEHEARIRDAARRSLTASFAVLAQEHVLPRSRYQPWIAMARDYYGHAVEGEKGALSEAIEAAFPDRFARVGGVERIDYPWSYAGHLLEAAVAAATRAEEPYDVTSPSVRGAIDALLAKLQAVPRATVLQVVADVDIEHVAVPDGEQEDLGETVEVAGVRMVRVANRPEPFIEDEIPSAGFWVERSDVVAFPGPASLLVATVGELSDYSTRVKEARRRVQRLIAALRLATASTARAMVDVEGEPDQVRSIRPTITPFPGWGMRLAHRPVSVGSADSPGLERLVSLIDSWGGASSWSPARIALGRLGRSLDGWTPGLADQVVDLAVGFEAVLSGAETTEVGLRLRTRAANLLATDTDPAEGIYRDVRTLYGLRSTVVHGATPTEKEVLKAIDGVTGVSASTWLGDRYELALDRWRDLLRRAILARCALAAASPPWPSGGGKSRLDVDGFLLEGANLNSWRRQMREFWTNLGLPSASEPASPLRLHVGSC